MAGRKSVMIDTQTGNRLETYQHDAYLRSMGEAVAELLDLSSSREYYAGLYFDGKDYRLMAFGRSDIEAARNVARKIDGLTPWDVKKYVDLNKNEKAYFTIECTKKLYDCREFINIIDVVVRISGSADEVEDLDLHEDNYNLFQLRFDQYSDCTILDLEDSFYALLSGNNLYYAATSIREIVDMIPYAVYGVYDGYSDEAQEICENCSDPDPSNEKLKKECDSLMWKLDNLVDVVKKLYIRRCTRQLYVDALEANCGGGYCDFCNGNCITLDKESVQKDTIPSPYDEICYLYVSGLFGCCATNKDDSRKCYIISCGTTPKDALQNARNVKLSEELTVDNELPVVACTKKLFTAFIMSDYYDRKEGEPVECHFTGDFTGKHILADLGPIPATQGTK